jgi:hypothetical protein
VCCAIRTKDKKPGQSGQRRSTDKVQRENKNKKIPVGARFSAFV